MRGYMIRFARIVMCSSVVLAVLLVAVSAQAGPKIEFGEDSYMKLSLLGQVNYSWMDEPGADKPQTDFYLRRARFIFSGQIMDGVKVFVETDNDKGGLYGSQDTSMDVQDAFIDLRLYQMGETDEHWLEAGLILLPFSFENASSAASLLGNDYNAEAIKFVNTFVWRDYGAVLRGSVMQKFGYRLGVFDGYDSEGATKNPDADLRVVGHVAVALLGEVQTGWFFTQNRLGKSQYVAVGAGIDVQDNATRSITAGPAGTNTVARDSQCWVVDFQSGIDLIDGAALTLNGAYYDWNNGNFDGNTAFLEGGVLVMKKVMPTFKWSLQDSREEGVEEINDFTAGVDYFMKGNNVRGGVEYRWGDSEEWLLLTLQFLL